MMISDILFSNNIEHTIRIFDNQSRFSDESRFIKNIVGFLNENELDDSKNLVFGLAKPNGKKFLFDRYKLDTESFINLIHKSSEISQYTVFGNGVRVEPKVSIAGKTSIGNFVNINRNVSIGHHCIINDFVSINPGCNIAGHVDIGERTEVGIGSTIIEKLKIGKNCIIGAGSVVTRDIPDNVIAYGAPCKIVRDNG